MSEPDAKSEKPPTVIGTIWAAANWVVERELLNRVVMVLVLIGLGAAGLGYAQDKYDGGQAKAIAPIKAEVAELRDNAKATDKRIDALDQKFDNAEERNARRFEVLYNAVLERRPQPGAEALMRTDGGP